MILMEAGYTTVKVSGLDADQMAALGQFVALMQHGMQPRVLNADVDQIAERIRYVAEVAEDSGSPVPAAFLAMAEDQTSLWKLAKLVDTEVENYGLWLNSATNDLHDATASVLETTLEVAEDVEREKQA